MQTFPTSWSPDGKFIALEETSSTNTRGIWILPATGDHNAFHILEGPDKKGEAVFSPDGRWLSYVSNESGRDQLYIAPFPKLDSKWQVSVEGGSAAMWLSSHEIAYVSSDLKMLAVSFQANGSSMEISQPRTLLSNASLSNSSGGVWSHDGKRLLQATQVGTSAAPSITVVTNWMGGTRK